MGEMENMCCGCDAPRVLTKEWCPSCEEWTDSYRYTPEPDDGQILTARCDSYLGAIRTAAGMGFVREHTGLIHLGEGK